MDFMDTQISSATQPESTSSGKEKNLGLFNMLCKKFSRRPNYGLNCDEDSRGSNSNSCTASDEKLCNFKKDSHASNLELSYSSSDNNSNNSSDTVTSKRTSRSDSVTQIKTSKTRLNHSTLSIRRAFQSLSLITSPNKSLSCNNTPAKTSTQAKIKDAQPKRILRQPVHYTYLKGISGLPTRRVPRSSVCCSYAR
jgi:hypothetical protein